MIDLSSYLSKDIKSKMWLYLYYYSNIYIIINIYIISYKYSYRDIAF